MTKVFENVIMCDMCLIKYRRKANGAYPVYLVSGPDDKNICTTCVRQCKRILLTDNSPGHSVLPFNQLKPLGA